ncbi:MAG: hypothetical protein ACXVZ4_04125 [Gaiellaceae bacterium]
MLRTTTALALVTLAAAGAALASPLPAPTGKLPLRGTFVPGVSLGGIRLGASAAAVRRAWGSGLGFVRCGDCRARTWYYTYPEKAVGAAVVFRQGRVVAVFTLGSTFGWKTSRGLQVGELIQRLSRLYPRAASRDCLGYAAFTSSTAGAVSSIYVTGEVVYGFALARPSEPVCQ